MLVSSIPILLLFKP